MKYLKLFETFNADMFEEHDVVVFKQDTTYKDVMVPAGTNGTLVHIFDDSNFMIEFEINGDIYVEPINKEQINKI